MYMTLDETKIKVRHKVTHVLADCLLICFVNRYVDVLPERNLEGGDQESWSFDEIELFINLK